MSGSGGNAFHDLLRVLAPAGTPAWLLVALAAAMGLFVAGVVLATAERWGVRLDARWGRVALPLDPAAPGGGLGFALAAAGTLGAAAAVPMAPHVFFVDLDLGAFAMVALLSLSALGPALDSRLLRGEPAAADALANWSLLVLALMSAAIFQGSANLIESSRQQSAAFGMGWAVFRTPFSAAALALFLAAGIAVAGERVVDSGRFAWLAGPHPRLFLLSALAAVYFLGGFESPLTAALRRSLGEDPGFLNHVTLADGSLQTRVAIGGLVFQLVCAATLAAKAMLVMAAMSWLRARRPRLFELGPERRAILGLACAIGAGLWEWGRFSLWN